MINEKQDAEKQSEFDSTLDAALAKYAAVEPRAGLEARVLANLRAEHARVPENTYWRWSVVTAVVIVVVVALALHWKSGKPSQIVLQHPPSTTTQAPKEPTKQIASNSTIDLSGLPEHAGPLRRNLRGSQSKVVVATYPKVDQPKLDHPKLDQPRLDRFPSPQPLSDQELALAKYVSEFPHEATLVAKTQQEDEKEMQRKMQATGFETKDPDSEQQER